MTDPQDRFAWSDLWWGMAIAGGLGWSVGFAMGLFW